MFCWTRSLLGVLPPCTVTIVELLSYNTWFGTENFPQFASLGSGNGHLTIQQ
jgi:hypothetical protein